MERKISSSLTEFYKVYGIFALIIFLLFLAPLFFDFLEFPFTILLSLAALINLFAAYDFWRMKEVELTGAGLIITERFFFNQKTVFIPFEKIETVKNKLWWLGNKNRITIQFTEITEFGEEISFLSNKFTRTAQAELVEELNRTILRNKSANRLSSAYLQ
jgi:flagella basal body P-ring formation protein FlgA